jgi:DNA-binding transcriptional MerR regulator
LESLLTSAEVIARTGISARQLQWWDERGIVVPAREGHRRLYSLDDLAEVAVICDLRKRGFSLQRVRKVIHLLQKEFKKRLVETVSAHSEYHLLTDGSRIYLKTSAEQVVDILKNSRQPMLTLCLSDTVRQIRAELASGSMQAALARSGKDAKVPARKSAGRVGVRAKRAAV